MTLTICVIIVFWPGNCSFLIVLQPALPSLASCSILIVLLLCRHSCDRRLAPSLPRLADRDRGCIAAAPDYFLPNCIAQFDTGTEGGVVFFP